MAESVLAVIFDFDGLLMDTESTNIASWERESSRWGLTLDRATFFVPHGGDATAYRSEILAAAVGASYDPSMSQRRRTRDRDELNAALLLAAGMDAWIAEAADCGMRTAVASSSHVAWVERHLRQVDALDRFDLRSRRRSGGRPQASAGRVPTGADPLARVVRRGCCGRGHRSWRRRGTRGGVGMHCDPEPDAAAEHRTSRQSRPSPPPWNGALR